MSAKSGRRIVAPAPALIASDLDGTLLRSDGSVSARTAAMVRAVQDANIHWMIATARPPRWLHDLAGVLGDHGLAIGGNGAFVYDVARREITSERTLARELLQQLVDALRAEFADIAFAVESSVGFGREASYRDPANAEPLDTRVADVHDLLQPLPGKLLARAPGQDPDAFLARTTEVVGARAVVSFSGSSGLAEISAAGVTKAAVLAEHCSGLGVSSDVVWAFGDMPNDIPMLDWAGTAFAVANAHPDVRAMADHVCAANDDDGVAQVLQALLESAAKTPT